MKRPNGPRNLKAGGFTNALWRLEERDMVRQPTYAADVAKDRDKYLRQRNTLARALRDLLARCTVSDAGRADAKKALAEIDKGDKFTRAVEG